MSAAAAGEAIVVTGASTGIGAATALHLARDGSIVFAGVRSDADAASVAALHPNVRAVRLDVTDDASIGAALQQVRDAAIPLRGLVNNAGIAIGGPLEFLPVSELRRQFDVNVFGAIAVTQAFLPMLRAARGRIVFVGSISGRLASPFIGPYSASKFALRALTDALRIELAPFGVGVTLVEPGAVKTPIWGKGRASVASQRAMLPPEALTHYGPAIERLFAVIDGEEKAGLPVERVSEAIAHALRAPHPPANRLLGGPAKAGSLLALVPARLRDRAIRRSMRLP
ncbi:short-chain dehydrogenase/reductase [Vulcanimicrobium alpinum]|uniref:Short-chain dehydrogenase/reductase n=1 Tax=Vulcanimicrobium alpinum TaxID=3016050 RepID=A0AAN2CB87_UNVUL|nr:SDR family oxidoreductase [Vulcanimicrobium alpinum]BDE07467.1 short-chain dehydrogenase/reductase [Vulcanimicrobium alpinum]